jgi:ubiquinone/menaquinone biosynthesis C-methylase UbiE
VTVTVVVVAFGLVLLILAVCAVWRWKAWPCPSWMVPLLENPYFQTVAGAELLLDRAGVAAGMAVLDAGCGPGRVTLPAAERVGASGRVVAVDVQCGMLDRLQGRLDARGVTNVELRHAGLGTGAVGAERFDVALMVTVLGEIPEPRVALEELHRALRPGGVLSVTEVLPDPHYLTVDRVRKLGAAAGFEDGELYRGRVAFTQNLVKPGEEHASREREGEGGPSR